MTVRRQLAMAMVVVATQGSLGCATLSGRQASEPDGGWSTTLAQARALALETRFDAADSVLARYARRNPGTPSALETAYWRALFKLDPANPNGSIPTALASLDSYLADQRQRDHVAEATTLRRIARQLESSSRAAATAATQVKDANTVAANAKAQAADANARAAEAAKEPSPSSEAEIKRLKEELAKANAELERIRKRLTTPPKPH